MSLNSYILYTQYKQRPKSLLTLGSEQLRLFNLFAALVAYGAGSFASRLARSLALTATTLFHCFLQISGCQSLDMFHLTYSPYLYKSVDI